MSNIKVYDLNAKEVGEYELSDEVFNVEYNEALIHEVVVAHLANKRQGTKATLTRAEVRGHAKKPWRQKGTGRARHSSTKSPIWTGGGMAFALCPRDFSKKVNKKAKVVAFLSAFTTKLKDNEVVLIKDWDLKEPKTKLMQEVMDNFKVSGRNIIVLNDSNENVLRSSSNIPGLSVVDVELLSTYDVVSNKKLFMTESCLKELEEAFK